MKGFDIAAKAVANLNDVHLIFVGAASKEQDKVAARLKECNLPPSRLRVRAYMDEREGLKQLFCGVDLAIMPSRTEGFGLAALEALSAGLPLDEKMDLLQICSVQIRCKFVQTGE